jgi:DNA-binding HxlR family transcriptional regulator
MAAVLSFRDRALQSRDAIELLANKWRITILHVLREGPLRTNALQGAIEEVSPKVLTQTLRGMERDGLIKRHIFNVVPPRVEYELTPMGRSLIKPLQDLCHWAKAHVAERDAARKKFDGGTVEKAAPRTARARSVSR